ncbi:MAG: high-potential iron-sulfur protein [Novosphingobium sp.]
MNDARRRFLALAGITPLLVLGATRAGAADPAACYDPNTLPLSQRSRRRSLGYVDASSEPARHCSLCSFFTGTAAGCGSCQMLGGGPVNAGGLCRSFAPKAQ